jgi:GTP pyrophosphokinase
VLGLLHTRFRPVPGTFDDYIGLPKENGYRSLHTCVYPVPDVSVKPVEFQIRTEEMHRQAEYGVAAHWLYKDQEDAKAEDQRQLERLRELLPEGDQTFDLAAFLDRLHRQVYDERPGDVPLDSAPHACYND